MTDELKDIRRAELNHEIVMELRIAMDRNPDLSVLEVINLVIEYRSNKMYQNPDRFDTYDSYRGPVDNTKSERISNSEILTLLKKYNRMRDLDSANYHGKVDA